MKPPVGPQYGFGLYVHWPYCAKICPYCDFNVYAAKERDTAPLVSAVCEDIERHREALPDHPALDSLFLGGGTPSLLSPVKMVEIIDVAQAQFGLKPEAEITLEANPNDVLRGDLGGWASTGINRLSIGVQALKDEALGFLGRDHNSTQARKAVTLAAQYFNNYSIDLIYALPGQSLAGWQAELSQALSLDAPHLSLYELTIAERTAFGMRAARGELVPMADEAQADLYEVTQAICDAADLPAYEVSNHARAPRYQSVHNHIYWNSGDWIGVGPGAHGRLTIGGKRFSTEAARRPADYISAPRVAMTELSRADTALELLAMGLRPASGLDLRRYSVLTGTTPSAATLQTLRESGHLTQAGDHIALTPEGRLLADHIAAKLVV